MIYDHTYDGQTAPAEGAYAQRLNGSDKEKLGMAKSLSVMPGDKIDIQVYAKYFDASNNNNDPNFASLMAAIISGTGIPAQTIIDGTGYALSANNSLPFVSGLDKSTEGNTTPKAYLNWIVFNRDYVQDMARSGYKRVTEGKEDGTNKSHQLLKPDNIIEIAEPGFIYIWLSNENETPVEVYFDDFKVTHTKSPVVQQDEYYAFGLTFNGYQRNSTKNNYLYNSKELQDELNIGWMDYGARMYMPEIGRWGVIDPLAETSRRWSPYNYAYNNPIRYIDPDGMQVDDFGNITYDGYAGLGDLAVTHHEDAKQSNAASCQCSSYDEKGNHVTYGDPESESNSELTGAGSYTFTAIGFAPLDYEENKYSAQMMATYSMDVNISVYEVPIYNNERKITGYQSRLTVRATSFVSSTGGNNIIASAEVSIGDNRSTGFGETKKLQISSPVIIRGDGQYSYVGEATFENLTLSSKIKFEGRWLIQYDKTHSFSPTSTPIVGLPLVVGGIVHDIKSHK